MALFVRPMDFAIASAATSTAGVPIDMGNDEPGMVWRTGLTGWVVLDLGAGVKPYDTVALVGTNLRATDTVRVRTGTATSGTGAHDVTTAAYTGTLPEGRSTTTIIRLASMRTERYLRLDFVATAHPAGFIEVMRACVGRAILCFNPDFGFEMIADDQSPVAQGPGYRTVDRYAPTPGAKFSLGWVTDDSWFADWWPMLLWAGTARALLFVPDETQPTRWPAQSVFGCLTTPARGKADSYNAWRCEAAIMALKA